MGRYVTGYEVRIELTVADRLRAQQLGLADRTETEFFQGGHSMHAAGTVEFPHKHLNWPKPSSNK